MRVKKWLLPLFAVIVVAASGISAYAGTDLEPSKSTDVETTVKIIRGMYNQTNSGSYETVGTQTIRRDEYGETVLKSTVKNGDSWMDRIMSSSGYSNYTVEFYYDNPDYSSSGVNTYYGPNFAFAVIDGKEYRYYFSENGLLRRIGPDGTVLDRPQVNQFLKDFYQVGCLYQNSLVNCSTKDRSQIGFFAGSKIYHMGGEWKLYGRILDTQEYGILTVDANTKLDSKIKEEHTWREGDNGYTWLSRFFLSDPSDYGYHSGLECFQVNTTGNHIDYIEGIYATH